MTASKALLRTLLPISRHVSAVAYSRAAAPIAPLAKANVLRPHFAKSASTTAGTKPRAVKTSTTRLTSPPKPAKVKKPKKVAVPKLKSWEKRGPDGKLLPLPRASKPKRITGFAIFISQRAKELRNDPSMLGANNKFDITKLAATVGQQWRSMSESDKKTLQDQADQANQQYERDLEKWRSSLTTEDIKRENAYIQAQRKKGKTGTAKLRDPTKPKQPRSAFLRFFLQYRLRDTEVATLSLGEQSKRASTAWKQLSADEKAKYEEEAAAEREQYQKSLSEWKNRGLT